MSPRRVPVSRRGRPAKPALSREAAVAAALTELLTAYTGLLFQYATATAAEQGTRDEPAEADEEHQLLVQALREAPAGEYPSIARTREALFSGSGTQRLAWAVSALLAALRAVPVPGGPATRRLG